MRTEPTDDGSCAEPKAGPGRHRVMVTDVKKVESEKGSAVIIECEVLASAPDSNNVGRNKDQYLGTTGGFAPINEQILTNIVAACGFKETVETQHNPDASYFDDAVVAQLAQLLPQRTFIIIDTQNAKGYINTNKVEPDGAGGGGMAVTAAPPMAAPVAAPSPAMGAPAAVAPGQSADNDIEAPHGRDAAGNPLDHPL